MMQAPAWLVFLGKCLDTAAYAVLFATAGIIAGHFVARVLQLL
jgi:hypothetical protein